MVSLTSQQAVFLSVAVGLAVVGAGAVVLSGPANATAVDQVPDGVDTVVRVDMAITNDTVTQELARAGLNSTGPMGGPDNLDAVGTEVDSRTDLDPQAISEVVIFGKVNQSAAESEEEYVGVVVHADWETEEFLESAENDTESVAPTEYERTTYNGQTVLEPVGENAADDEWVGVLGDGQFVLGTEAAVTDSIDVATGDAERFDGKLRSAYEETAPGLVKFAVTVPENSIPAEQTGGIDTGSYQSVETIAGSYYTTQTGAGVEVRLGATGTEGAKDVADVTDGALSIGAGTVQNETAKDALRAVEVERDGQVVTVSYEESVDSLEALLRYLYRDQFA